jgi:NAD(P)-dependent dehydrogenase (short-subunit alcohol dehydrogenase family)
MNQIDLADRVAVITGGSGGIGLVTAERMRLSGAMVVLWDLDAAALRTAAAALPEAGIVQLDVTDEAAVARCTAEVIAKHGRIDILVNAAGVTSRRTSVVDFPVDLWRRIVEINLTGRSCVAAPWCRTCRHRVMAASSTWPRSRARRATRTAPPIPPPRPG